MLSHLEPQDPKNGKKRRTAKYTVKRRIFWRHAVYGGWGGGPSPIRRGENCRTAMPRPGGPWPDYQCAAAKLLNFSIELAKVMGSDCLSKASSMQKLEN